MKRPYIGVIATIALLSAGSTPVTAETIEDTVRETLAFPSGSHLTVTNTNGDIEVTTWDRDEIEIEARKKVRSSSEERARSAFDELTVQIEQTADGVRVDTRYPRVSDGWWRNVSASVRYEIRVPRLAELTLETVNGKIAVDGVYGSIDLETTNGGIDLMDGGGRVSAQTTNGGIDVELREVTADEAMDFRTTNGSITLSLPSEIRADLSARTTNGSVHTDFPITVQGSFRKNRLSGEINGGGASIELKTTNGSIRIREI